MAKFNKWVVKVFTDRNDEHAMLGYQLTPEPQIVSGFLLVKDITQIVTQGFPLKDISGFRIEPDYEEEK